jgi:hypothetical protein
LETARANSAEAENILQTAAQPVAASFHEFKKDFKTLRQRLVFLKGTTSEWQPVDIILYFIKELAT